MKRLSYTITLLLALVLISCSEETIEVTDSSQDLKLTTDDKTNIGTYKGVFTTLDSEFRGQIEINIANSNANSFTEKFHKAEIRLQTGEVLFATSKDKITSVYSVEQAVFMSNDISFNFSVNRDGTNPIVSNVIYNNTEADALIAKHTNLAPVETITGTYACFLTCFGHPVLDGTNQTFNLMFTTDASGDTEITTQVVYDEVLYNGIGVQDNCNPDAGTTTDCNIESGNGVDSDEGFIIGVNPVKWNGNHTFNNEATGPGDCSEVSGIFNINTSNNGFVFGFFRNDPIFDCPVSVNTISNNGFNAFTGAGFAPVPSAGQLDSDIIIANGFNGELLNYGGTEVTGVYAKGESTGGVSQAGIYAFDISNGGIKDNALGFQPATNDFTPGYIEVKLNNTTGNNLTRFQIDYDIYVLNNKNGSNSLNFSYSNNGVDYTPLDDLDFVSPEGSDGSPWVRTPKSAVFYTLIPNGQNLYLRFTSDEVSGTGGYDEFALDNLELVEAD